MPILQGRPWVALPANLLVCITLESPLFFYFYLAPSCAAIRKGALACRKQRIRPCTRNNKSAREASGNMRERELLVCKAKKNFHYFSLAERNPGSLHGFSVPDYTLPFAREGWGLPCSQANPQIPLLNLTQMRPGGVHAPLSERRERHGVSMWVPGGALLDSTGYGIRENFGWMV